MEIVGCENQMQKLANQLQTLQMVFDKESLATLRRWFVKNTINEMKNIYFLKQNDEFGKPCYPVVIHVDGNHNEIVSGKVVNELSKIKNIEIYLVHRYGKFAYCVPENSKKLDVFLDDLLNKKQISMNNSHI